MDFASAPLEREAFGPYRILALIGQGGGGVVYRAWDPRLQREVTPQVVIENVTRAAISPDGKTIAFLRDEHPEDVVGAATLWFWTASSGEQNVSEAEIV